MTYLRGVRLSRGIALAAADANGSFATVSEKASMFNDAIITSYAASIFDSTNLTVAESALIFNDSNLTAAKGASIFDNTNLAAAKTTNIIESANLSIDKINNIITNANITNSKAQEILNDTSWATRDLTSAASILYAIHDDWADNKITSRDNRATTPASILGTNEFAQKFRPVWSGGTASDGNLKMTESSQKEYCNSIFTIGTWEVDFYINGTDDTRGGLLYNMYINAGNYYYLKATNTMFNLEKQFNSSGTTIISTSFTPADQTWVTVKITRGSDGQFEIFSDGVSKGTTTDTDITSSSRLYVGCYGDVDTYFDNLKVW